MKLSARKIAVIVVFLGLALFALPMAMSAFWLNLANANIARAASLPSDSPNRVSLLAQAELQLSNAQAGSNNPRIALAQARSSLVRGEPQRAAQAMRSTGVALREDAIAQYIWADVEWQSSNSDVAFEYWRSSGAFTYFINESNRARVDARWDDAAHLARIAVGVAPDSAMTHFLLGDALSHVSSDSAETMRELDRAAELERDPELLSTVLSRKGEVLAAQGNYQAAFDLFDQAMKIAPLDARPRTDYARTLLLAQPNAHDHVVEMLIQSIAIAPWYTSAYITLAEIAESRGDSVNAEEWYRKGLARNVNHPALLYAHAKFYVRQNRLDDAKTNMILALRYETRADELQNIARDLAKLNAR